MFSAFQDGVVVECDGKIIMMNDAFVKVFGYSTDKELIDKDLLNLIAGNDVPKVAGYFQMLNENREMPNRFEFMGRRKDNVNFFAEASLSTFIK